MANPNEERSIPGLPEEEQFSLKGPTEEEALKPLPDERPFHPTDQLAAWTKNVQAVEEPGELDVASFVKAQSMFIKAQTRFMISGPPPNVDDAYRNISRFSRAQGDFIAAQNAVLEQLGIV